MSRRRLFASWFAVAAALSVASPCSAQSRGDGEVFAGLGILLSQSVLLPAYVSTTYYGVRNDKRMPGGWLAGNLVSAAASISVGAVLAYTSNFYSGQTTEVVYLAGAGAAFLGAGVVVIASALQSSRDDDSTSRVTVNVAPMGALQNEHRMMGISASGRF